MFGWLKKKDGRILAFESNAAAFDYACTNLPNKLLLESVVPAMVEAVGAIGSEGERNFQLRIADKTGGWEMWGCTLKGAPSCPGVGDLVGFRIVRIASELPAGMNVIGYIAVKLAPVLVPGKGWKIDRSYVPDNIKQTIRF